MNATGMGLGMWIFWIVVIFIVVLIIKLIMGPDSKSTSSPESPMDIPTKRYTRGENNQDDSLP